MHTGTHTGKHRKGRRKKERTNLLKNIYSVFQRYANYCVFWNIQYARWAGVCVRTYLLRIIQRVTVAACACVCRTWRPMKPGCRNWTTSLTAWPPWATPRLQRRSVSRSRWVSVDGSRLLLNLQSLWSHLELCFPVANYSRSFSLLLPHGSPLKITTQIWCVHGHTPQHKYGVFTVTLHNTNMACSQSHSTTQIWRVHSHTPQHKYGVFTVTLHNTYGMFTVTLP